MRWDKKRELWVFYDWQLRKIVGDKEYVTKGAELDSALSIKPKYFENQEKEYEAMTLDELDVAVADLKLRGTSSWKEYKLL